MKIEERKLSNNLRTLFINSPGSTAATVQFWFRAGSALESKDNQGIAHFLEHMFFKGTKTRPGAKIAYDVEGIGGEINAFTSFDYTCYYINAPSSGLIQTIDILLDMVSNPEFSQTELVPEREVVFEEYRRSIDNPSHFAFHTLQKEAFTKGYAHPILGSETTIKQFSREQLIAFRNSHYHLQNSMLVIAGDLSLVNNEEKKLISTIEKYQFPNGTGSTFPEFKTLENDTYNVHQKEVRQAVLSLCIQAPAFSDKNAAAEDLLINCLAQGESSRLYQRLVQETSLATSVSGSTMYFANGGAHFLRFSGPVENIPKILAEAEKILKELGLSKPFSEGEIIRIKNQYMASKVYEKESIESFAFSLGHGFAQNGDINCEEEFIARIRQANSEEVNSTFSEILQRHFHFVLQLPIQAKEKKYNSLLTQFRKSCFALSKQILAKKPSSFSISKFDPNVKIFTLRSGIKFIYRQNSMTPTFVLQAYIKGGLAYEKKESNGSYHLLSRVITMGHAKADYNQIKNDIEERAASLSGFSGKNSYGLNLHGQSEHFSNLVTHFLESLLTPNFPEKFVKLEKELILRSINNQKEDPVKQCFKTFNSLIFNGHPYGQDILGTPQNLKKFNSKYLTKLHFDSLKKNEMVITFSGNMPLENVLPLIEKELDALTPRKKNIRTIKKYKSAQAEKIFIKMKREQSHIFIGRPSFKITDQDDLKLKMLTTYLSGQSSELFCEIRDKQSLCYSVQPVHMTALEAGYWGIYIGTGNEKKDIATKAILELINKIATKGLSSTEFERVKTMIEGQNSISIQTNDDYANLYSTPVLHDLNIDFNHISQLEIKKIKLNDFNAFLKKFLHYKWNIIQVGPA